MNNLQQQLSTVEKQTFDRHQYLEEQVDECNSKVGGVGGVAMDGLRG